MVSIVLFLCFIALFVKVAVHLFAPGILEMDSLFFILEGNIVKGLECHFQT